MPLKLPPLPDNKQLRIAIYASAGIFALVVVTLVVVLFTTSDPEPVVQKPAAPVEKPLPPAPPNSDNSKIILELFSPSDQSLTNQLTTTGISQQIEQTLTVSFVLTKCLIISQDDYRDTYRALVMYAQLSNLAPDITSADAKVREIAESATASYSLVYSRTSCSDQQLPLLAKQLAEWTNAIFKQ